MIEFNWCSYKKRKFGHMRRNTTGLCTQEDNRVKRQQKVTICKPRREASKETNLVGTLILDFQLPEM